MPLLSLDPGTQHQVQFRVAPPAQPAEFALTSVGVSQGLFPGRGLVYSLLLHLIVILAILFHPARPAATPQPAKEWQVTMLPKDTIYLPALGGGSPGSGGAGSGPSSSSEKAQTPSVAAQGSAGASYPGRQTVVSNPPNPTNRIQTLLQPRIPNLPILKTFVPLPNMVKLAPAVPAPVVNPPPSLPNPEPRQPKAGFNAAEVVAPHLPLAPVPPPPEPPKLTLPASIPQGEALPVELADLPPAPTPQAAKAPQAARAAHDISPVAAKNMQTVLAISPLASPLNQKLVVPKAQARGRFVITPLPALAMLQAAQGSPSGSSLSAFAPGMKSSASSANATAGSSGANANARSATGGVPGTSTAPGAGGKGSSGGSTGSAVGQGGATGSGAGSGPGTGTGTGKGGGAAPGNGAFPGISIEGPGFEDGAFSSPGSHSSSTSMPAEQGSYGLEIVATGSSGGGLGDFGIFHDETVFTVYINMFGASGTADDPPSPSWTLQYALAQSPAGADAGQGSGSFLVDSKLSAPYPIAKVLPKLSPAILSKYSGQMVVVYALIDVRGKLTNTRIVQSPAPDLKQPVMDALGKWVFRPAKLNGQPVAVKALFGIPLE